MKKLLALCFAALFVVSAQAQVGFTGYPAPGQLPGTVTNDNASAGNIGELLQNTTVAGSAVSVTSGNGINVGTVTLTPGDWEVTCSVVLTPAATTTVSFMGGSVSLVSNTNDATPLNIQQVSYAPGTNLNSQPTSMNVGPSRKNVSVSTSVFCVAYATFAVSTMTAWGGVHARRVR